MSFLALSAEEQNLEGNEDFRRSLFADNMRRSRVLAWCVIALDSILAITDIVTCALRVDGRFRYLSYLAMYLIMVFANAALLVATSRLTDDGPLPVDRLRRHEAWLMVYLVFVMSWGALISLMDQKLYGQVTVFLVNLIVGSVLVFQSPNRLLLTFLLPCSIILGGLPFFQFSSDILIGHYVNVVVIVVLGWAIGRNNYARYCTDFESRRQLSRANRLLEKEIERNRAVNLQLADANRQLNKQSLIDELTGIPNRRAFRNYIDAMYLDPLPEGTAFSVLMIDLDHFKEYNDAFGHNEGDRVLVAVAHEIQSVVRHEMDIAARWGGEEFLYAAFSMGEDDIAEVAETIRTRVQDLRIPHVPSVGEGFITASIGVGSAVLTGIADVSACIERADKAMYRAKAAGRNRTEK